MSRPAEAMRAAAARRFFGPAPKGRRSRIMVTPGGAEANDPNLVERLVAAGMDVLRINCAFGNPGSWERTAANLRRAERRTGRLCALFMDLAGPKLRTAGVPRNLLLRKGSKILLTEGAKVKHGGKPRITVTLPEVLGRIRAGDSVWFDDGRFGGSVQTSGENGVEIAITFVLGGERRLLSGKSVNVPGRDLGLPALTARDLRGLRHAASLADMIGLSYIHTSDDVAELQGWLRILGRADAGIVVKIENQSALRHATEILRQAKKSRNVSLLVARGDLTVEAGAERLAAIQVRLLHLARTARIPSIIATGILSTLVDEGMPARAELIDAAAAREADCVMLHGGPHVLDAVRLLDRLLRHETRNH